MKKRVLVAHPEVLYKQLLVATLSAFPDINVVGESRYFDELLRDVKSYKPDIVLSAEDIFPDKKQLDTLLNKYRNLHLILLTREAEKPLSVKNRRLSYFYTGGYVIDLYRAIDLALRGRTIAQPALIKNVLSKLRSLEEEGLELDAMLITFDREKLKVLIDIIFGKSYEEIQSRHGYNEKELELLLNEIIKDLEKLSLINR